MKRTEINAWYDPGRVHIGVLYDTDLMPFERTLAPGAEFKTAAVSLVTFRNGDGFQRSALGTSLLYFRGSATKVGCSRRTPWIYNTWEPFERKINRDTTLQLIDVAAVTWGWISLPSTTAGNRNMARTPLIPLLSPEDSTPIRAAVEAKGMRLGLWIPMAAIGLKTADYVTTPGVGSARSIGQAEADPHHGRFQGRDVFGQRRFRMQRQTESTMPSSASIWLTSSLT